MSPWLERQRPTKDARGKGGPGYQETGPQKNAYERIRRAEYHYGIKLRKLARHVGDIVKEFPAGDPEALQTITKLLKDYAAALKPWAGATARAMLAEVNRRDEIAWAQRTKDMSKALRAELLTAPTGIELRRLEALQVELITSVPLDAAKRIQELTIEGLLSARRAEEIKKDIQRTTHVTESRATFIARTEVGRASTNLTQARATHIGSEGYVWRTAEDSDVRESHKKLNGSFHRWDSPPVCDPPNYRAHPGCIFNCRCYPDVIIPEQYYH